MTVQTEEKFEPWLYAVLGLMMLVAFSGDLVLPLGTAIWVIYLLVLALSFFASRPFVPILIAAVSTVLIITGYFFAPAGVSHELAQLNRSLCVATAWILAATGTLFIRSRLQIRRQEWLQQGEVGLAARLAGEQTVEALAENVVGFLAQYMGAASAAIFVNRDGQFHRTATYGVPEDAPIPAQIRAGDGLLGEVARDGSVRELTDVPENYIYVGSSLGRSVPRHVLMSSARADELVNGVIEFGFVRPLAPRKQQLLERVGPAIGVAIRSAQYRLTLRKLLEETQQQAAELRAQGEEMRAANEELEAQSKALQDSQARLEHQQAELEQSNAQLEAQTQELEAQRDDLARSQVLLQQQARELEQGSRYKSEFLSNMSHELRTPLNSLLILAQLLADNKAGNLNAEQVKFARTIYSAGNDLLVLINDILDISKIEAGQVEVQALPVTLADLAEKLRTTFLPGAEQKGLDFVVETDPSLPRQIVSDPQRLEQVLKNFLSNAIKFTHKGEVALILGRDAGGDITFTVRDTGIGIAADQQQAIFEPFRQADGTISRRYGGTGLGLSISRELATLLGGRISITSREGSGSSFTLLVPQELQPGKPAAKRAPQKATIVAPPRLDAPLASPSAHVAPASPIELGASPVPDDRATISAGSRIMLAVEDDPDFAAILYDLAHELGFQCIIAGTADEGVIMARQYLPQAIILDVGLPDHTGLFVLDRLKHDLRTRHIPVHVVSAGDYVRKARALGAAGYSLKPVKREELIDVLQGMESNLLEPVRRVLVVEDDATQLESVQLLLGSHNVSTVGAKTASECLERLRAETFDCMVLDLTLPDASGLDVLDKLGEDMSIAFPPVIVYTGRELSSADELRLRKYAKSIIIKGARSPERLLDEVTLFLHQVVSKLPDRQQEMLAKSLNRDEALLERNILIVEDDVRNVYALTSIFETHGAKVTIARNGLEALKALESPGSRFDLVLMDVMMPEMDGLTATREIRGRLGLPNLPIIMLTAKAMPQDQELCLASGANDYLAKPLDVDKLLSLVRVWISR
jgi:signal transduction histidine kinase/CheY-like chemotaxis protein